MELKLLKLLLRIVLIKVSRKNSCTKIFCTKLCYICLGITGATIKIDGNGDSEGNFSVLSLKPSTVNIGNFSCNLHLVPVAFFQQGINNAFPVSESSIFNFCFFYSLVQVQK